MSSDMEQLVEREGIKIDTKYSTVGKPKWAVHGWEVTLRYGRKKLKTPFYGGAAVTKVSAADVLASLCSDASSYDNAKTYKAWLSDFGVDASAENKKAFMGCKKISPKLHKFLENKFSEFCNAQH